MAVRIRELVIKAEVSSEEETRKPVVSGSNDHIEQEKRYSLSDDFYARDERKNRER